MKRSVLLSIAVACLMGVAAVSFLSRGRAAAQLGIPLEPGDYVTLIPLGAGEASLVSAAQVFEVVEVRDAWLKLRPDTERSQKAFMDTYISMIRRTNQFPDDMDDEEIAESLRENMPGLQTVWPQAFSKSLPTDTVWVNTNAVSAVWMPVE